MLRALAPAPLLIVALALAGCTTSPQAPDASPSPAASASASGSPSSRLPSCDAVSTAAAPLLAGLTYDETVSTTNTAQEAYDQRVCVFVSPDGATQLGVTIAQIAFQQTKLDAYATLPNAIADDRLAEYGGVIQTFPGDDPDDGHLAKSLSLFDTEYSVTILADDATGSTEATLPQLTVPAAIDAAFAVRALIG